MVTWVESSLLIAIGTRNLIGTSGESWTPNVSRNINFWIARAQTISIQEGVVAASIAARGARMVRDKIRDDHMGRPLTIEVGESGFYQADIGVILEELVSDLELSRLDEDEERFANGLPTSSFYIPEHLFVLGDASDGFTSSRMRAGHLPSRISEIFDEKV